ncbi:toll-like receptor 3 [Mizuhopecten yessoensis]|uniref:toll-like receptor 3 n=1 Tax=Mizuhopecten yessoensis TaxID=6573 RepID=UPI000B45B059|nr:toll-like receptor 3 [Mizuhopecten yessoensis]
MVLRFCVVNLAIIHLVCCRPCSISDDGKTANCSNRHLTQIPKLSRHTEYLDLSGNNFTTLRNSSFEHLPQLKKLNLNRCHVDHIDEQVFAVLGNLQKLSISENRINILHQRFEHLRFHYNPLLTHLDLSYNTQVRLQKMVESVYPDKVFGSLINLQVLIMDLLPNPVFGEGFSNLTNIKSLIFRDCAILHLRNDTFKYFQNLTNLTSLEMSNCQVHIEPWVKVETAVLQYFYNLQNLDLSGTMITFPVAMDILYGLTVTTNSTHPVREMKLLNLYNVNPLRMLWIYDVTYTVKVTTTMTRYYNHLCIEDVNIGKNGITEMEVNSVTSFINSTCLKRFVLRENNFLLTFPKFLFVIVSSLTHAVNLQEFDYSFIAIQFPGAVGNQVSNIGSNENNKNLAHLIFHPQTTRHFWRKRRGKEEARCEIPITSKHLSHVRSSHLLFPFSVQCDFDVSQSPMLTYIDMSYMAIADMDFSFLGANLSYFDVSGLDFGTSGSRLLGNLVSVQTLVIRDANLDRAFSNGNYIFRNVNRIDELDMSSNHLNSLPNETLKGLETFHKIKLAWNFLKEFPPGLYQMTNLSYIDLRYNQLLFLDKITTDWLDERADMSKSGITVLLDGNRFACTCDSADFVSWIMVTNVTLHQRKPANYNCTLKDGTYSNMKYIYDNRDDFFSNCDDHLFWLEFSISAISLVVLALVCATIGHTFRWRLLYFFYRKCKITPGLEDTTSYSLIFLLHTMQQILRGSGNS